MKEINRLSFVVCLAMCVTLVVACGDKDSGTGGGLSEGGTSSTTTTSSGGNTSSASMELTGMMMQSRHTKGMQDMIRKLEEDEGITINMQVIPDDQFDNLFTMRINSGEAPDLIDFNVANLYGFLDAPALLVNLSNESWVKRLVNPSISTHANGNVYAWGYDGTSGFQAMLYNKDLFASVGYSEPPTTVAEFDDLCEKLLAKGITPIGQPSDSWVPQIYMTSGYSRALGSTERVKEFTASVESGAKKFTDYPEVVAVVDYYLSFFEKGYMNSDYLTTNIDGIQTKIVQGEIGMMMSSSGLFATLIKNNPDANVGMFNLPAPYDTTGILSGAMYSKSFCVPKTSKNIDLAKRVFELWSTPEYLDLVFADTPGFPAFADVSGGNLHDEISSMYNEYMGQGNMVMETNNAFTKIQPLYNSSLWILYQEGPNKGWSGKELLDRFQKDLDIFLAELDG